MITLCGSGILHFMEQQRMAQKDFFWSGANLKPTRFHQCSIIAKILQLERIMYCNWMAGWTLRMAVRRTNRPMPHVLEMSISIAHLTSTIFSWRCQSPGLRLTAGPKEARPWKCLSTAAMQLWELPSQVESPRRVTIWTGSGCENACLLHCTYPHTKLPRSALAALASHASTLFQPALLLFATTKSVQLYAFSRIIISWICQSENATRLCRMLL